jgi:hypothetical protein
MARIELAISPLPRVCSTPEPHGQLETDLFTKHWPPNYLQSPAVVYSRAGIIACPAKLIKAKGGKNGAGDGSRTRNPQLGRLIL